MTDEQIIREWLLAARRNEWRLDAIDVWRRETVDPAVAEVARMSRSDEIADEVAARLRDRGLLRLTIAQKAGAVMLTLLTVASLIRGLVG